LSCANATGIPNLFPISINLIITVDEKLIRRAASLALTYHLRGYDSVHLAAAEVLERQPDTHLTFACFDHNLNDAARALGITVI